MAQLLKKIPHIPFHKRLFLFGTSIFVLFLIATFLYQYNREKNYRKELLNDVLQSYNYAILQSLEKDSTSFKSLDDLIGFITNYDLRVTIIDLNGNVITDSKKDDTTQWENHLRRPEIIGALKHGQSYSLRRSSTFGQPFFYSARRSGRYIVRSALPFNLTTRSYLKVDTGIIIFFVSMALGFILMIFFFSHHLGRAISSLRTFSYRAEKNELKNLNIHLPNNDIGDITGHIIRLYTNLNQTKQDLMVEREKLIKHLQISKEGLGVFSPERTATFSNTLFIQYINLISDYELSKPEGIFEIEELARIRYFLNMHSKANSDQPNSEYLSEHILVHKNGKTFNIECIIFPDSSFEISINNITQQEEETRLKRQLTQNVAHELKTPVSSMKGFLETIIENPDMDEQTKQMFIQRSFAQANRLTDLLKDISVLNRMDEAYEQFEKVNVNLGDLIHDIVTESNNIIKEKNMKVQVSIPEQTIIYGTPLLLYSIFRNLLDNAIVYAGEGKSVNIRCYRQDKEDVYFSFSDNGPGVEEKHLNRIFERFYRVDKGRSRKLGGTGLGLAIVKNAVIYHKGEISAKNRPEGGLEFVFSLKKNFDH